MDDGQYRVRPTTVSSAPSANRIIEILGARESRRRGRLMLNGSPPSREGRSTLRNRPGSDGASSRCLGDRLAGRERVEFPIDPILLRQDPAPRRRLEARLDEELRDPLLATIAPLQPL